MGYIKIMFESFKYYEGCKGYKRFGRIEINDMKALMAFSILFNNKNKQIWISFI